VQICFVAVESLNYGQNNLGATIFLLVVGLMGVWHLLLSIGIEDAERRED
jgi:hypothetical protein